jgi:hypothetical protein
MSSIFETMFGGNSEPAGPVTQNMQGDIRMEFLLESYLNRPFYDAASKYAARFFLDRSRNQIKISIIDDAEGDVMRFIETIPGGNGKANICPSLIVSSRTGNAYGMRFDQLRLAKHGLDLGDNTATGLETFGMFVAAPARHLLTLTFEHLTVLPKPQASSSEDEVSPA